MPFKRFNQLIDERIPFVERERMIDGFVRESADHRRFHQAYVAINTRYVREKHSLSTVVLAAHLYLESTEFMLGGSALPLTHQTIQQALTRVDGVLFRVFLAELGDTTVLRVMDEEQMRFRRISQGDRELAQRRPIHHAITTLVDEFIDDARGAMTDEKLMESDAVERRRYLNSVIMKNRPAHPIKYPLRCAILAKELGSLSAAKALFNYTKPQAAALLEMDLESFESLFCETVAFSTLDYFAQKTNFVDRRFRVRNFLPVSSNQPTLIGLNEGPSVETGMPAYDVERVDDIFDSGYAQKKNNNVLPFRGSKKKGTRS